MKKLTAFIAVVALGLLSSLTANAQINITVTKLATAPAVVSSTGININTTNLSAGGVDQFVAPFVNDSVYFNLGYMQLTGSPATTAGSFILDTTYRIDVVAGAFSGSTIIDIDYSIVSASPSGGKASTTATNVVSNPLATFAFLYAGNWNVLTFNDISSKTAGALLKTDGTGLPLQVGNLGIEGALIVNPVPEPSTYALMGASGLAALVGFRRFRSKKANKA